VKIFEIATLISGGKMKIIPIALSRLIDRGIIDEEKAILIAEKVMRSNAIRVHNIK